MQRASLKDRLIKEAISTFAMVNGNVAAAVTVAGLNPYSEPSLKPQLFECLAELAAVNQANTQFQGVSIAPESEHHALLCFFDDNRIGFPLVGGKVLRHKFRKLRVCPLPPFTLNTNAVAGGFTAGQNYPAIPKVAPQRAVLNLWMSEDMEDGVLPPFIHVPSGTWVIAKNTTIAASTILMQVNVRGARTVTLWASNDNNALLAAATLRLKTSRPERYSSTREFVPYLSPNVGPTILGGAGVVIPAAGDNNVPVETTVNVDPGATLEFIVDTTGVSAPVATDGLIEFGLRIGFSPGT